MCHLAMGLTHRYKTTVFFTFIIIDTFIEHHVCLQKATEAQKCRDAIISALISSFTYTTSKVFQCTEQKRSCWTWIVASTRHWSPEKQDTLAVVTHDARCHCQSTGEVWFDEQLAWARCYLIFFLVGLRHFVIYVCLFHDVPCKHDL